MTDDPIDLSTLGIKALLRRLARLSASKERLEQVQKDIADLQAHEDFGRDKLPAHLYNTLDIAECIIMMYIDDITSEIIRRK